MNSCSDKLPPRTLFYGAKVFCVIYVSISVLFIISPQNHDSFLKKKPTSKGHPPSNVKRTAENKGEGTPYHLG